MEWVEFESQGVAEYMGGAEFISHDPDKRHFLYRNDDSYSVLKYEGGNTFIYKTDFFSEESARQEFPAIV